MKSAIFPAGNAIAKPANPTAEPTLKPILRPIEPNRPEVLSIHIEAEDASPGLFGETALLDQLRDELDAREDAPRTVVFPAPVLPLSPEPAIDGRITAVLELMAEYGVTSHITSRALLPGKVLQLFTDLRDWVMLSVPVMSVEAEVQQRLEPSAAAVKDRLAQAAKMRESGVHVQIGIEPMIPALTDTADALGALLRLIGQAGFRQITAGYLYLRPGQKAEMHQAIEGTAWAEQVLAELSDLISMRDAQGMATYLPKSRRQLGYARLIAAAAKERITVSLSRAANPDFQPAAASDGATAERFQAFLRRLRRRPTGKS